MKREEIKAIFPDATDEQLKSVMDLNGADIEREKGKRQAIETELADKKTALEKLNNEFTALKESNAGAEDFKAKFEALQKEVADKEAAAKTAAEEKEKAERIAGRFNAVVGEKKFSHDAIRADYLKRFSDAIADEKNAGKSDEDILHELTKDDGAAFVNVTKTTLKGGKGGTPEGGTDEDTIRRVMGLPPLNKTE